MIDTIYFDQAHTFFRDLLQESNAIPVTGHGAHKVVRRRGSHIFNTIGSQMAVRLSALRVGRSLPPGRSLVLISLRG
jgi:hypothetical protein